LLKASERFVTVVEMKGGGRWGEEEGGWLVILVRGKEREKRGKGVNYMNLKTMPGKEGSRTGMSGGKGSKNEGGKKGGGNGSRRGKKRVSRILFLKWAGKEKKLGKGEGRSELEVWVLFI